MTDIYSHSEIIYNLTRKDGMNDAAVANWIYCQAKHLEVEEEERQKRRELEVLLILNWSGTFVLRLRVPQ